MTFYGRESMLRSLDHALDDVRTTGRGRMIAMRGRRQVGKSRLVTHFAETRGIAHLYTAAVKNASPAAHLERLARDAASSPAPLADVGTLLAAAPASWDDAFGRLALAVRSGPAVVILDEFPWAVAADATLEGTLQNAWDRTLEDLPILLLLVGSDLAMMERLSEHDRPLFGRAGIMTIDPFDPGECAAMLGDASAETTFDARLVTGGYPRMVNRLARAGSVTDFIHDQLTDEASDLAVMAQLSLDAEFAPDSQARSVLSAIGNAELGVASFSRIAQGMPGAAVAAQTAVTRALKQLVDVKRVVALDVPVGAPKNTRLRRYRVADSYLRFWFRFIEPQLANMSRGRPDLTVQALDQGWASWRGKAIEPLVRDGVWRLAPRLAHLADAETVGGWWNRDNSTEVDIVAATRSGDIPVIGSIKWRLNRAFDAKDVQQLHAARHAISGADKSRLLAVCPGGVRPGVDVDLHLTASDLLAAWSG